MNPPVRCSVLGQVATPDYPDPGAIHLALQYDPADPFAVSLVIQPVSTNPKEWVFARELLADGRRGVEAPGEDVTVTPTLNPDSGAAEVRIDLSSPAGYAVLWLDDHDVQSFLDATYRLVPAGAEASRIDWTLELAGVVTGDPQ